MFIVYTKSSLLCTVPKYILHIYVSRCHCTVSGVSLPVPSQPTISVVFTTATSISLSWSVPSGSVVGSYEVMWTSDECPDDVDEGRATVSETSCIIEDLREGTSYTITVSATNSAGTSPSDSVTEETEELGNYLRNFIYFMFFTYCTPSSISCSHFCECICSDLLQHHCPVGGSGLHPPQWRHNRLLSAVWGGGEWEYTDYKCLRR